MKYRSFLVVVAAITGCGDGHLRVPPTKDAARGIEAPAYADEGARDVPADPLLTNPADPTPDNAFPDSAVAFIPDVAVLDSLADFGLDAAPVADVASVEGGAAPEVSGVQCGDAACGGDWYCFICQGTGDSGRCVLPAACVSTDLCKCFCNSPLCDVFGRSIYCVPFE